MNVPKLINFKIVIINYTMCISFHNIIIICGLEIFSCFKGVIICPIMLQYNTVEPIHLIVMQ